MIELVGSIARKVAKRFAPMASEAGLSVTEALALWKLRTGPCKSSEIAARMGLSPSTMTGILDRLEAGGWLLRRSDPEDRRAVLLEPTKKLSDFAKSAKRRVSAGLERAFKDLPPGLAPRLSGDLALVLERLEADEEAQR